MFWLVFQLNFSWWDCSLLFKSWMLLACLLFSWSCFIALCPGRFVIPNLALQYHFVFALVCITYLSCGILANDSGSFLVHLKSILSIQVSRSPQIHLRKCYHLFKNSLNFPAVVFLLFHCFNLQQSGHRQYTPSYTFSSLFLLFEIPASQRGSSCRMMWSNHWRRKSHWLLCSPFSAKCTSPLRCSLMSSAWSLWGSCCVILGGFWQTEAELILFPRQFLSLIVFFLWENFLYGCKGI